MAEIRVAVAGVGNSASALVQGVHYYKDAKETDFVPGLVHVNLGGYHVRDIRFVAAFDVNKSKIGKDLSEAIFAEPNCCPRFVDSLPNLGVEVLPAPILDGVGPHMKEAFRVYSEEETKPVDVVEVLKRTKADILVNYMPVGSYEATRFYAKAAIEAGCAFVNCIPEFIASDREWASKFEKAGLPVAGDDVKSQIGATILHREIARLFVDRGVKIDETYQLNIGGDTDFQNMTLEERLKSKRISKTEAVTSLVPYDVPVKIGPSDYIPFLGNKKICYIYVKGRNFGDQPVRLWVTLEVFDSPNSAGVVIDVIRATKIALDRGIAGPLISVSAYAFKHPPIQVEDPVARKWFEEFIEGKRER
ncbi:MAG: inositol-3-phosphate synthase [Candidatus Bathyarchaeia archaeon]